MGAYDGTLRGDGRRRARQADERARPVFALVGHRSWCTWVAVGAGTCTKLARNLMHFVRLTTARR